MNYIYITMNYIYITIGFLIISFAIRGVMYIMLDIDFTMGIKFTINNRKKFTGHESPIYSIEREDDCLYAVTKHEIGIHPDVHWISLFSIVPLAVHKYRYEPTRTYYFEGYIKNLTDIEKFWEEEDIKYVASCNAKRAEADHVAKLNEKFEKNYIE